jgi:5'-deoxynucleotidase YfbR-like HD superfamily hydrolase
MAMQRGTEAPPRAWQRMLSGRRLDLLDPSPLDIEIEDIAHGLARVARWNGQTSGDCAFSVAQHCVMVEEIAAMISPFKAALGLDYRAFENRLLRAIHVRFSLPPEVPEPTARILKRADKAAAFLEATQLAGFSHEEAERFFGRLPNLGRRRASRLTKLAPMPAEEASQRYLARFRALV